MTLETLGDYCGVTAACISQWESGFGMARDGKSLSILARTLGVPSDYLTFGDPDVEARVAIALQGRQDEIERRAIEAQQQREARAQEIVRARAAATRVRAEQEREQQAERDAVLWWEKVKCGECGEDQADPKLGSGTLCFRCFHGI